MQREKCWSTLINRLFPRKKSLSECISSNNFHIFRETWKMYRFVYHDSRKEKRVPSFSRHRKSRISSSFLLQRRYKSRRELARISRPCYNGLWFTLTHAAVWQEFGEEKCGQQRQRWPPRVPEIRRSHYNWPHPRFISRGAERKPLVYDK